MAAGSDLGYPIIVTWQCVLYLLQCVFCICCSVCFVFVAVYFEFDLEEFISE